MGARKVMIYLSGEREQKKNNCTELCIFKLKKQGFSFKTTFKNVIKRLIHTYLHMKNITKNTFIQMAFFT